MFDKRVKSFPTIKQFANTSITREIKRIWTHKIPSKHV